MALGGCNIPYYPRFDAVPGPVVTPDLVAAGMEEPTPLSLEKWQVVDAALDLYLASYDELRPLTIAPFVKEVRRTAAAGG